MALSVPLPLYVFVFLEIELCPSVESRPLVSEATPTKHQGHIPKLGGLTPLSWKIPATLPSVSELGCCSAEGVKNKTVSTCDYHMKHSTTLPWRWGLNHYTVLEELYTIHNQGYSKASGKVLPGQAEKQTALDGT